MSFFLIRQHGPVDFSCQFGGDWRLAFTARCAKPTFAAVRVIVELFEKAAEESGLPDIRFQKMECVTMYPGLPFEHTAFVAYFESSVTDDELKGRLDVKNQMLRNLKEQP